ncbi:DUF6498-containing protein [Halorubrum luteum]
MPSTSDLGPHRSPLGFAPLLLANLIPLGGVIWLDWDPATLVAIYALELLFTFPLAGVKALFAARPPRTDHEGSSVVSVSNELTEMRGSVELVSWLPPLYPRNLPFATTVVLGAVWFVIAGGVVLSNVVSLGDALTRPEVLVSALALVVGQSIETWRDYLRGGYETASAYAVIETPARQAFFLVFVLMVTPGIGVIGVEGVLSVIVLVKLLIEWSAYRAATDGTGRVTGWLSGPDPLETDPSPISVPDGRPDAVVSTQRRAALYDAVFDVVGSRAPFLVMPFIFVWFVVLIVLGDGASPVLTVGVSVAIGVAFLGSLTLRVLMEYLRYGSLEYRRYGDEIVAYDTLLATPQWSASIPVLRDVQVVPDRLADRLLDTRTIVVTTGWGDDETRRYLGPTADADHLVDTFELPVRTIDLDPLDRRPIAVVLVSLVAFGGVVVVLAIGPWIPLGELLFGGLTYGVFGIPIGGLLLRFVWGQAYSDRTTDPIEP